MMEKLFGSNLLVTHHYDEFTSTHTLTVSIDFKTKKIDEELSQAIIKAKMQRQLLNMP
jgi:hypothetical protein